MTLKGKVIYVRILRIHIRSVNPPLHSRQPWDLTPHSHHQRESRIHIRSRNPSSIHVSHGNLVDSLHQWEFSFNSQVGCESVSNSHWACESNLKLNWPNDFASRTLVYHWTWHFMTTLLWIIVKNVKRWIHITDVNLVEIPISDVNRATIYNIPRLRMEIGYPLFKSLIFPFPQGFTSFKILIWQVSSILQVQNSTLELLILSVSYSMFDGRIFPSP